MLVKISYLEHPKSYGRPHYLYIDHHLLLGLGWGYMGTWEYCSIPPWGSWITQYHTPILVKIGY